MTSTIVVMCESCSGSMDGKESKGETTSTGVDLESKVVGATLRGNQFYVFSSNAVPFEPEHSYGPFAVYTMLEHDGNFAAAATALRLQGYGQSSSDPQVDISHLIPGPVPAETEKTIAHVDPGPMPAELLRIPGFVSEVMDHCLETAPYPNAALAFCGALSLLAVLAGRKVCDIGNNRTNIYLLALGYSSVGKDWPRKLNTEIMHRVGMIGTERIFWFKRHERLEWIK